MGKVTPFLVDLQVLNLNPVGNKNLRNKTSFHSQFEIVYQKTSDGLHCVIPLFVFYSFIDYSERSITKVMRRSARRNPTNTQAFVNNYTSTSSAILVELGHNKSKKKYDNACNRIQENKILFQL